MRQCRLKVWVLRIPLLQRLKSRATILGVRGELRLAGLLEGNSGLAASVGVPTGRAQRAHLSRAPIPWALAGVCLSVFPLDVELRLVLYSQTLAWPGGLPVPAVCRPRALLWNHQTQWNICFLSWDCRALEVKDLAFDGLLLCPSK